MRRTWAIVPGLGAGLCWLVWAAARSDFRFRGCPGLELAEWVETANCSDGWFAMVLFGGLGIAFGTLAIWLLGRRHA